MGKKRIQIGLILILLIPLGFYTKFYSGPGHNWVGDSLGGVFYEMFWILLFAFIYQKTKAIKIAIWVFLITCSLEFLQLWHPPFLEYLRSFFIGQILLGNSFNKMDIPYCALGCLLGYFILYVINKQNEVR